MNLLEKQRWGNKKGTPKLLDAFYIKLPITQGGAESGSIFIGFQKKELDMILENLTSFNGLSLYMISGTTNRLYTFHDNKIAKETFERQEMIITESLKKNSQLPIDDLEKTILFNTKNCLMIIVY